MKKVILSSLFLLASCSEKAHEPAHEVANEAAKPAHEAAHWSYDGEAGPQNWAKLAPENAPCSGKNQSPINLAGFTEADLPPIEFNYGSGIGKDVENNGHTIQVNYADGNAIKVDGIQFNLKQFHFHAPSENHINGKAFPMEAHLVHKDNTGDLAVVALMFEEGEANPELEKVWAEMPATAHTLDALDSKVDASGLLPWSRDYYRFNGSLTTPPCTEGVRWIVMKNPVTASKEQIEKFAHVMHHPNNRPVQPTNARTVLQ
ncbi:MAG: carbonic anhydrase family protein [Gammaproteobacteria bacterium]|nr:carbonic anhydrase family protein [Gammaproteobacteria bacterium]MBU1724250.1 carbonic anhydrase family protein [Gammaproteobacteria bacterium]MBU2006322.1 carbonic anhydrase family protein [Gammaproteobacteria bacterium]